MKSLFLLFALMPFAKAQDVKVVEVEEPVRLIRVELLVVRLPEAAAVELQPELRDPARVAKAQEKLLAMVKKKEAELIDWPVVMTKSGNRAVVENIHEVKYPIAFEQPQVVPAKPVDPKHTMVAKPTAPENPAPAKPEAGDAPAVVVVGGVATTFETRNTGVTLEIEPNILPDGKTVEVQMAPQHVTLVGYRQEKMEVIGKYSVAVEQPEFQTQKTTTNLTLQSGQPHLVAFYKLRQPAGTVELFLTTLTIVEMGKQKVLREVPLKPGP
jgi:hypothetical protein